jgi:hypothetical protein
MVHFAAAAAGALTLDQMANFLHNISQDLPQAIQLTSPLEPFILSIFIILSRFFLLYLKFLVVIARGESPQEGCVMIDRWQRWQKSYQG